MSPVTMTASGRRRFTARTPAASTCVLSASCGRNVDENTPPRRSRNGTRAGDSSSRTCVSVSCATVAITAPVRAAGASSVRSSSGSPGPRSSAPSPSRSTSVASSVEAAGPVGSPAPPHDGDEERGGHRGECGRAPHSSRSPSITCSRIVAAGHERGRGGGEREQPADHERDLARRRGEREVGEAGRQPGDERPQHEPLEQHAGQRPPGRRRPARRRPAPPPPCARRRRPRAAARRRRGAPGRSSRAPGSARTGRRGRPRARRRAARSPARRGTRRCGSSRRRPAAAARRAPPGPARPPRGRRRGRAGRRSSSPAPGCASSRRRGRT